MPTKTPAISNYEFAKIILEKQNNKNFKKIINDILDLEIDSDNRYDVSECNTIIDNFLELGEVLKRYEFFEKAGYIFDEVLPMADDYYEFDDYNEDNWFERENNLEPEQVHYSTAKKMLSSAIRRVIKELNPPKDAISSLKSYIIPIYSKIKMIDIDGEIFKTLNEAQTHLNMLILKNPSIYLVDKIGCDIKIILEDEFLANYFNETDTNNDWEFIIKDCFYKTETTFYETSIVDALLECLDVSNELIDEIARENDFSNMDDFNYESFRHYKKRDNINVLDFHNISLYNLIKNDIYQDMNQLLKRYETTNNLNKELVVFAFKVLINSYKRDSDTLERLQNEINKQVEISRMYNMEINIHAIDEMIEYTLYNLENNLFVKYIEKSDYKNIDDFISYLTLKITLAPSPYSLIDNYTFEENRPSEDTFKKIK